MYSANCTAKQCVFVVLTIQQHREWTDEFHRGASRKASWRKLLLSWALTHGWGIMHLWLQEGTFAQGLLYAHHCVGIGITEMTGVCTMAEQLGRGEKANGGKRL